MSVPPAIPHVTERQFQTAVIDYARRSGWRVCHFHDSRRQIRPGVLVGDRDSAGFPDLVMVRNVRMVIAELKATKGRLSVAQKEWLQALTGCAAAEVYLWRPADWSEIEAVLGRRVAA